jgi:hypothetical protein
MRMNAESNRRNFRRYLSGEYPAISIFTNPGSPIREMARFFHLDT